jgi:hypothetical protein
VDLRVDLIDMENLKFLSLQGLELRPLSRPASSQSLYRLSYSCSSSLLNLFETRHNRLIITYLRDRQASLLACKKDCLIENLEFVPVWYAFVSNHPVVQ